MIDPSPDEGSREKSLRLAYTRCIRWLGQRDHSSAELVRKLVIREFPAAVIDETLRTLTDANYLDDARFACTLAEQRSRRGYGPRYISAKLRERGIGARMSDEAIELLGVNWSQIAGAALRNRFSEQERREGSQRQQGRMARFLQSRGFSSSDVMRALRDDREQLGSGMDEPLG